MIIKIKLQFEFCQLISAYSACFSILLYYLSDKCVWSPLLVLVGDSPPG